MIILTIDFLQILGTQNIKMKQKRVTEITYNENSNTFDDNERKKQAQRK